LSLLTCVGMALGAFLGHMAPSTLRSILVVLTAVYFVAALLATRRQPA